MSYRGRAQSDQSTRNFLSTHYYFNRDLFTKCPLCAKIFLGAGDTKILKGVKKAGDKINTKRVTGVEHPYRIEWGQKD